MGLDRVDPLHADLACAPNQRGINHASLGKALGDPARDAAQLIPRVIERDSAFCVVKGSVLSLREPPLARQILFKLNGRGDRPQEWVF